jgi:hypothetical protein
MKKNVPSITDNNDSRKVGNKNLVQTIEQRINSYISGSDDAKRTITDLKPTLTIGWNMKRL